MKKRLMILMLTFGFLTSNHILSQATKIDDNNLIGVFDGRTPCQELAKQLHEITIPECIKIKWRLILYKDPLKENTGIYVLEGFVFRKDNLLKGKWRTIKGTNADPDAIVYELDTKDRGVLLLQKADDNVLFFLDQDKNIMIGNRNFSYTLNRTIL
jgi:hypothetical protein